VVDATYLGIENPNAAGEVFNVGTGVATTVMEVATLLKQYYGLDVPLHISGNYRIGDIRHNLADISKIKSLLGFIPKVSFAEGLKLFTNWVNTQHVGESKYEASIEEMKIKGLLK
jgi:dTDP-L-rhamnose 4-epimerase